MESTVDETQELSIFVVSATNHANWRELRCVHIFQLRPAKSSGLGAGETGRASTGSKQPLSLVPGIDIILEQVIQMLKKPYPQGSLNYTAAD